MNIDFRSEAPRLAIEDKLIIIGQQSRNLPKASGQEYAEFVDWMLVEIKKWSSVAKASTENMYQFARLIGTVEEITANPEKPFSYQTSHNCCW